MKSSVKLHFCRWDLIVAAAILLLAGGLAFGYWGQTVSAAGSGLTAVVSANGEEIDRVDLASLKTAEERTYTDLGYTLTVEFSPDGVCVETSDCPTQDCVHTGTITRAGQSIVCLPARISVQLKAAGGQEASSGDFDMMIG